MGGHKALNLDNQVQWKHAISPGGQLFTFSSWREETRREEESNRGRRERRRSLGEGRRERGV